MLGPVSFSSITQSLAPSVWSKLIYQGGSQGFYIPSIKIVTDSGVPINYHSLCSPYNTVLYNLYGKKVTHFTGFSNVHLKIIC